MRKPKKPKCRFIGGMCVDCLHGNATLGPPEMPGVTTGIKDKNGKMIRDGDFVKFKGGPGMVKFMPAKWIVTWDWVRARIGKNGKPFITRELGGFTDLTGGCTIVGHIHHNPEFLKWPSDH